MAQRLDRYDTPLLHIIMENNVDSQLWVIHPLHILETQLDPTNAKKCYTYIDIVANIELNNPIISHEATRKHLYSKREIWKYI